MRIIVFGKDGQLGRRLRTDLSEVGDVVAFGRMECDIADAAAVEALIAASDADVIVNAAAYTAVDRAEEDQTNCFAVNASGPLNLARAAQKHGAALIHYSTDYVFDGEKTSPYLESDSPNPINVYGKSKLAGEIKIAELGVAHLILRVGWLYSEDDGGFLGKILAQATEKHEISVVSDQTGTPTSAAFASRATRDILRPATNAVGDYIQGNGSIMHLSCHGEATWLDFAEAILALAREKGVPVKTRYLAPIALAAHAQPAKRPRYSCLGTGLGTDRFTIQPPHWRDDLRRMFDLVEAFSQPGIG